MSNIQNRDQLLTELRQRFPAVNLYFEEPGGDVIIASFNFVNGETLSAEARIDIEYLLDADEVARRLMLISDAFRDITLNHVTITTTHAAPV